MKSSALMAMCLAMTACSTPKLPDPRFDFPDAPESLKKPVEKLQPITMPDPKKLQEPEG